MQMAQADDTMLHIIIVSIVSVFLAGFNLVFFGWAYCLVVVFLF